MGAAVVAGVLAGLGIAMPVGAVGVYLVSLTARTGVRVGAAAALGVATADGLYATAAVLFGSALAGPIGAVAGPLRVVAALALVAVAVHVVVHAVRQGRADAAAAAVGEAVHEPAHPTALRAYLGLLALTLTNPATVVYFVALVVGNRSATAETGALAVVFVAAVLAASAGWQLVLVGGGRLLGAVATGHRGRLVTGLVAGALVLALAVRTLLA
ncbi:LysE family transporter [Angustibacter peucedani]